MSPKLERRKPELLLDILDEIVELACAAHWNCGLYPGQQEWSRRAELEARGAQAPRLPPLRLAMRAALSAAVAGGLVDAVSDTAFPGQIDEVEVLFDHALSPEEVAAKLEERRVAHSPPAEDAPIEVRCGKGTKRNPHTWLSAYAGRHTPTRLFYCWNLGEPESGPLRLDCEGKTWRRR